MATVPDACPPGTTAFGKNQCLNVDDPRVRVIRHERNQCKGAAIKTAVTNAAGEYIVILDADLEYDPNDIPRLLAPVLDGRTTVVVGNASAGDLRTFAAALG